MPPAFTADVADARRVPAAASEVAGGLTAMIAGSVAGDLKRVEQVFDAELESDLASVNSLVRHVARFRGKMLRPTLTLLCGKAVAPGKAVSDDLVKLAAVVEMVHMSTLVHDDVLDDAELRRRGATINHLKGNEAAVLLGDYLISHSYALCSGVDAPAPLDPQWAARIVADTTNTLCEGELLQVHHRGDLDLEEKTYFEIIRRKTGALTAASCLIGARIVGGDEATGERLRRYGELVGMAFQVQDDVLDLAGNVREVGKSVGVDAEKQKLTLPLIHFLKHAPQQHRELLRSLLRGMEPDRAEKVRQLVVPSPSVDAARTTARRLTEEAVACLEGLPESRELEILKLAAEATVKRVA